MLHCRQTLLADLGASPAGRLQAACGQAIMLESFLESVEARPMASASIAQASATCLPCTPQHHPRLHTCFWPFLPWTCVQSCQIQLISSIAGSGTGRPFK